MKIYAENRKATYDYQILEKFEAGLVLLGQEVKSIRNGKAQLIASYVIIASHGTSGLTAELIGAKIPAYQIANAPENYNPERSRPLLLHQKELNYLHDKAKEQGFALIPLKIYDSNGRIKLEFGLARGKKQFNKKDSIKKRDIERDIRRHLNS